MCCFYSLHSCARAPSKSFSISSTLVSLRFSSSMFAYPGIGCNSHMLAGCLWHRIADKWCIVFVLRWILRFGSLNVLCGGCWLFGAIRVGMFALHASVRSSSCPAQCWMCLRCDGYATCIWYRGGACTFHSASSTKHRIEKEHNRRRVQWFKKKL